MFSIFNKSFKSSKVISFESLKTDMHSHLIPAIDDGSPNIETSVSLAKQLHDLGFQKLITTPHVMSDFYKNTPNTINNGLEAILKATKTNSKVPEIMAAAEYLVDFEFESKLENKQVFLTFGLNYILIETSFISAPPNFDDIIFKLQVNGYTPVLAHPERFLFLTPKDYESLKSRSVLFQINALSLVGYYGRAVQQRTELLISKNMIDFVGTDCHNKVQADLYSQCFTNKHWHRLIESGFLKNHQL